MEPNKKEHKAVVETYAEDMAQVIENDREGLVKKIIHGAEEQEKAKKNLSPESQKNKFFMLGGGLLIMIGLGGLLLSFFSNEANTVEVERQAAPLIFNDKTTYFEVVGLKPDAIIQTVLSEINTSTVKEDGVEGIYLIENKKIVGLRRFLALIRSNFVPGDNTLFVSDKFLMGMVKNKEQENETTPDNNGFFLLLKVRGTADIFDAMRRWEDKMFSDLHVLLGVNIDSSTQALRIKSFEDGVIENRNARILYNADHKIILLYLFADDNSIIVTNSQNTAHQIVLRLTSSKTQQ